MAFALAVTHLIETLQQPGCPVCASRRDAVRKSIDHFLWENLMDREVRLSAVRAGGFCPAHAHQLVVVELAGSGRPLGVNILYETLARNTAAELRGWRSSGRTRRLKRLVKLRNSRPLPSCPACAAGDAAALDALTTLFEELERRSPELITAYIASDGLCRAHFQQGLAALDIAYPNAASWLASQTATLLETQATLMREFIRKQNWEYRAEQLTSAEADAWRKVLTFFTGYPSDQFTFKRDTDPLA